MKNVKVIGIIMVITIIMAMSNAAFCDCEFEESFSECLVKSIVRSAEIALEEEDEMSSLIHMEIRETYDGYELVASIDEKYLLDNPSEECHKAILNVDDIGNIYIVTYDWDGLIIDTDYCVWSDIIGISF